MRYDTKIWFQVVTEGERLENGDYPDPEVEEVLRYASVVTVSASKQMHDYGAIVGKLVRVHIQNHYDGPFDYIRIGEERYTVYDEYSLRYKGLYVCRRVE